MALRGPPRVTGNTFWLPAGEVPPRHQGIPTHCAGNTCALQMTSWGLEAGLKVEVRLQRQGEEQGPPPPLKTSPLGRLARP